MSLELQCGQRLTWFGSEYQVFSINGDEISLVSDMTRRSRRTSLAELEIARDEGELRFLTPPIDPGAIQLLFANEPEKLRSELLRRRQYINAMMLAGRTRSRPVIAATIKQVASDIGDSNPPSVSTVYNWVRAFEDTGRDNQVLIPKYADRGDRTPRIKEPVLELMEDIIDSCHLQGSRPTLAYTKEKLDERIMAYNAGRKQGRLKPPSYKSFCAWYKRRIDPYWALLRREGPVAAKRKFRGMGKGIATTYPLERVEIDHTHLDVLVTNPINGKPCRPTLTWAIDHNTRVILGFVISYEPPNTHLVQQCIKQILRDKTPLLAELGIRGQRRWDMHGKPVTLVTDNGPEFHSISLKDNCADLGISLQYCPPGKPWFKARTERWIGTLNKQLIHMLPGTTCSNPRDRGSYRSEEFACLSLEEVRTLVTEYITCQYHERRHSTLGMTPRQAWEAGIAEYPPATVHDSEALDLALCMVFNPTISDTRIQAATLRYSSVAIGMLGEQLGKGAKVRMLIPPDDISTAYVQDPLKRCVIPVPCVTEGVTKGMSFDAYQLLKKLAKEALPDATPSQEILDARIALDRKIRAANKRGEQAAAKRRKGRNGTSTQSTDATSKPTGKSQPPITGLSHKESLRLEEFNRHTPPPAVPSKTQTKPSRFDYTLDDMDIVSVSKKDK